MKAIHYDAEGDILSITFSEAKTQTQSGIELSDNIVLYYNPETAEPRKLILVSYQALVGASAQQPLLLDGLAEAPAKIQRIVKTILARAPLSTFLQMVEAQGNTPPMSRLHEIFTPTTLQTVIAT